MRKGRSPGKKIHRNLLVQVLPEMTVSASLVLGPAHACKQEASSRSWADPLFIFPLDLILINLKFVYFFCTVQIIAAGKTAVALKWENLFSSRAYLPFGLASSLVRKEEKLHGLHYASRA